jgi:fumarate hydratase class II
MVEQPNIRVEHDAFGPVEIPGNRYWGAQTQRALGVFEIGEERFPACLVRTLGLQKLAAARANRRLGSLDPQLADAIEAAAGEVWEGRFDDHFPLMIWQTGSGTQTNMNANVCVPKTMYGRRPRCKREIDFQRSVRVRSCIRPLNAAA